jgi:hypothetical protein
MFQFIANLFRKKPAKPAPFTSRTNTKHAWANDALAHITGSGMFLVRPPESVSLKHAQAAVMVRLTARFGSNRVRTKQVATINAIEVSVK